jgi:hypothetical protein
VFCFELKTDRKSERISIHSNKWMGLQSIPRDYRTVHQNLYISQCSLISKVGSAMTETVIFRCLNEEVRVRFEVSPCWNCDGQCCTKTGFSSCTSIPLSPLLRLIVSNLSQRRTLFESKSVHLLLVLPLRCIFIRYRLSYPYTYFFFCLWCRRNHAECTASYRGLFC